MKVRLILKKITSAPFIILASILLFLGLLVMQYAYNLYQLATANYIIQQQDVFLIDTFKMYGRAYLYEGRSTGRIEFTSRNGYTFTIHNTIYEAAYDQVKLYDTLQYSEAQFVIFANLDSYQKYHSSSNPFHIDVLQIQFGNTPYINLPKVNQLKKQKLIRMTIFYSIILLFLFFRFVFPLLKKPSSK